MTLTAEQNNALKESDIPQFIRLAKPYEVLCMYADAFVSSDTKVLKAIALSGFEEDLMLKLSELWDSSDDANDYLAFYVMTSGFAFGVNRLLF